MTEDSNEYSVVPILSEYTEYAHTVRDKICDCASVPEAVEVPFEVDYSKKGTKYMSARGTNPYIALDYQELLDAKNGHQAPLKLGTIEEVSHFVHEQANSEIFNDWYQIHDDLYEADPTDSRHINELHAKKVKLTNNMEFVARLTALAYAREYEPDLVSYIQNQSATDYKRVCAYNLDTAFGYEYARQVFEINEGSDLTTIMRMSSDEIDAYLLETLDPDKYEKIQERYQEVSSEIIKNRTDNTIALNKRYQESPKPKNRARVFIKRILKR